MEADFSGYATRTGLKCSDGRTIMPDAFKHQDKMTVPLVWQHNHSEATNVLGHAVLEARADGVYAYCYLNETAQGQSAKQLVIHKDINALSIYAGNLVERAKSVYHGVIKEVSLVLSGANPGAFIDNVRIAHADGGIEELEDEAVIFTGSELEHSQPAVPVAPPTDDTGETPPVEHADTGTSGEKTVKEVYDSLDTDQKDVVHYMIGTALAEASLGHSDDNNGGDSKDKEGTKDMTRNVFEQGGGTGTEERPHLSHSDVQEIIASAQKDHNGSLKGAIEEYALAHGITNISLLFPDAQAVNATPELDKRRTEWCTGVINGTRHSPFSRVKTFVADLTFDQARAKGYIKGTLKKEEFFGLTRRTTSPTTIYKKQKLDRDDIVDITDLDVVSWLKAEMRIMLDEELARAVLIGDGRNVADDDKIKDPAGATDGIGIRSIANENELYAATVNVNIDDASSVGTEIVDEVIRAMRLYKGSGTPTFYTTLPMISYMLLIRDTLNRRIYRTVAEIAAEMGVSTIVAVEAMEDVTDLVGIVVNLSDYTLGADRGGEINMFDDFDIDYNQYKYLIETRCSGALTKIRSALVIRRVVSTRILVSPVTAPTFVVATGVVTIPTQAGVVYKNNDTQATLSAGAQAALASGATLNVIAVPDATHYFESNVEDQWSFTRP